MLKNAPKPLKLSGQLNFTPRKNTLTGVGSFGLPESGSQLGAPSESFSKIFPTIFDTDLDDFSEDQISCAELENRKHQNQKFLSSNEGLELEEPSDFAQQ